MIIDYILKRNSRTRQVKLSMSQRGLTLIVPVRFNEKHIPSILEEHKPWIEEQYAVYANKISKDFLPKEITLAALNEIWKIQYIKTNRKSIQLFKREPYELVLMGDISNQSKCRKILLSWLRERAQIHLVTWLNEMSRHTQLNFNEVCIRSQQTRFGSCSYKKNISLNDRLLFLPKELVSYVILHELCHTKHLNHSASFWELLATWDPDYAEHRRALLKSHSFMPVWV